MQSVLLLFFTGEGCFALLMYPEENPPRKTSDKVTTLYYSLY